MSKDVLEGFKPFVQLTVEANIWSQTIARHYIKTVAELTGKSIEEIKAEIDVIQREVKEELSQKMENGEV
ncbi:hypothetical protein AB9P05_01630 [Roseivirga sp. BDSF3-8]|uniref:hypothetical protein n=1 Tax=Roseivirga sp. BDSF3-8 TaxID=3241598 RepID=UPI003532093D